MYKTIRTPASFLACLGLVILTYGCTHPELLNTGSSAPRHRLLLPNTVASSGSAVGLNRGGQPGKPPINHSANPSNAKPSINLTGRWRVGFQANQEKLSSSLEIAQNGNGFQGRGVDDQTGNAFKIEEGRIDGTQLAFVKKYENINSPPVRYTGRFSILNDPSYQGPYMAGQYSAKLPGGLFSGEWEAAMVEANQPAQTSNAQINSNEGKGSRKPPNTASFAQDHAPDLSGKWDVGYEYDFKTIHSTMFLEQYGGKLSGHGIDSSTNEKFVISKGWYHYPQMTIVRSYPKSRRALIFKAEVTNVRDSDYQGPYLKGKTQGGGDWEAQLVK